MSVGLAYTRNLYDLGYGVFNLTYVDPRVNLHSFLLIIGLIGKRGKEPGPLLQL
jgi:hypothetical protein